MKRGIGLSIAALVMVLLAACTAPPIRSPAPVPQRPPDVATIPDAVPRIEPRSARGNPPFYEVFGKRYFVLSSADGYLERGVASWYGPGFHTANTAMGEPYDMYGMTAAHKTLPLPAYARVTNLRNGKSVVVRVNDRGPFKDDRIIDLSYTAAAKLDMLRDGTALVEVQTLKPGADIPEVASAPPQSLYVQAGAFGNEANANKLAEQLRAAGHQSASVRRNTVGGRTLYRVRLGPVPSVQEFDRAVAQLKSLGVNDARLAAE